MSINTIEIIFAIILIGFVLFLCVLMGKFTLRHLILGSIFILLFAIGGSYLSIKLTEEISNKLTSEYTRSEVVTSNNIEKIEYKKESIYVTYINNEGKIITEQIDPTKITIHKNAEKNYFIKNECKRYFVYWDEWDVYLKDEL